MTTAALIYAAGCAGSVVFQIALILGAPWGRLTQGGTHPGALPRSGRVIALVSIPLLVFMALSITSVVGLAPGWAMWTAWVALGVQGLSMVLNWITPSAVERRLWGPVMTGMFCLALVAVFG